MASFFLKLKQFTGIELIYNAVLVSAVQQKNQSSVQFSRSVVSDALWPHTLQHARPPCPSPTPGAGSNSCQLSRWCHPTSSSSVITFSSCLQSFPASGSFSVSQFFTYIHSFIECFPNRGHCRVMRKECHLTVITCLKVPSPNAHWGLGLQHMN